MKTTIVLAISAILFSFSIISCQKGIDGGPSTVDTVPKISFLVKSYVEKSNRDFTVVNYTYDQSGRVTTTSYSTGLKKVYTYQTNSYTVDNFMNAVINSKEVHLLINSIVDSVTYFGPNADTTSEKYIYDNYKHVVVEKQFTRGQLVNTITAQYDAANKNIIKVNTAPDQQIAYTYTNYPLNISYGLVYEPPSRENLVATTTYSGKLNMVQLASYDFDNFNRVSKETVTNEANSQLLLTREYKY